MKTSNKILFGGLAIVFFTSIALAAFTRTRLTPPKPCEELAHTSKTVDLIFDKVSIGDNIHVTLLQGDFKVQIESLEKAMPYVNHHVEEGVLKLYLEDNHSSPCPIEVALSCPQLSSVQVVNGSSIVGKENFSTPQMEIQAMNGSLVRLKLTSASVTASATNSADIELSGEINKLDISAHNSSRIRASNALVNTAKVKLINSASAQINADTISSAKLMNSSSLSYIGDAVIVANVESANSSSITKLEEH